MRADVTDRQSSGIQTDDLVIHAIDPGLALLHQFRLETAIPVTRHGDRHLPVLTLQPLGRRAVAPIGLSQRGVLAILVAQMRSQFGTQHPLHEPDLELLHQPGIAKQILRPLAALQQLVQQFLGYCHRPCSSQEAWTKYQLHRRSDTLK